MRFYRLKHKETGKYCVSADWSPGNRKREPGYKLIWRSSKDAPYLSIIHMKWLISRLINNKFGADLDQMEVENSEMIYKEIPGTIRLKTVRARIEKDLIISKLGN